MAISLISNFAADVGRRYLTRSSAAATLSLAKLSAGKRVLSARDDAAALAIGSRLNAEIVGLKQAAVNAGQGSAMLQVADGAMSQVNDMLVRMKTLAVQSGSGQLSASDRGALNTEYQALASEIDRISQDTEFAGTQLVNADTSFTFKVGTGTSASSDEITASVDGIGGTALGINGTSIADPTGADDASARISDAIDSLQTSRAKLGASRNRLDFAASNIATTIENTEAARSRLIDLDVAGEMSNFTSRRILVQAGLAMAAQANQGPKSLLRLFV